MERNNQSVGDVGLDAEKSSLDRDDSERLMTWTIKAYPQPTFVMDVGMTIAALLPGMYYVYGWFLHESESNRNSIMNSAMFGVTLIFFFWVKIVRQKTFYSYRITENGGEVDYWLHFSKFAKILFKAIAIFVLVAVLAMISIMPMMIFALVGAGAMAIPAALKLLAWESEVEQDGFEWERVQLISTDRSRNLVILQRRYDPDIPFEQNYLCFRVFLPKHRIDEFLDCCKKYAPSNVEFEEGRNIF
jgi:hypothetical protein